MKFNLIRMLPMFSVFVAAFWSGSGVNSIILHTFCLIFILALLYLMFWSGQDFLLYYPNEPADSRHFILSPDKFGLDFESVTIVTSDRTEIHAFLLKVAEDYARRPTMVMLHGNAGNIGHRLMNAKHIVTECHFNVLLMEYRGYGLSGGEISEQGFYDDAISAIRYVKDRPDLNSKQIILHGRSLGGAVAIYVASQPEFSDLLAVMLENTFMSLPDIAHHVLNFFLVKLIPVWCYKNKYPSIDRIRHVTQPTLFLTGRADTLVPPKHMDSLAMASGSIRKEVSSFPQGTHNETWTQPGYLFTVSNFVKQLL